jgi:hypothetical protein
MTVFGLPPASRIRYARGSELGRGVVAGDAGATISVWHAVQRNKWIHATSTSDARSGDTYFVTGSSADGYQRTLVDRSDDTLCSSDVFARKADRLKALRAVQRHAATSHVIDEAA